MRVVLDTNVLARTATGPDGPAGELLRQIVARHTLVLSSDLIAEFSRILRYGRMRRLHGFDDGRIEEYVGMIKAAALLYEPDAEATPSVVAADPADDAVIAAAVSGQAEVICTLDRHFRHPVVQRYCQGHGIRIMADVELLELLRRADAADHTE